jgi:iron complex transport system permease protein
MKVWIALGILGAAALMIGLALGAVPASPGEVLAAVLGGQSDTARIIREIRVPRILLAFATGGVLGVSGAALQALIRNPLAEPYLLGISGGAGLAAVIAISVGAVGLWSLPVAAFLGAGAALLLVYRLSIVASRRLDSRVLVLAGVVVAAFCTAIMSAVLSVTQEAKLRNAFLWLLGGFGSASWPVWWSFVAYSVIPLGFLWRSARPLDLLSFGDDVAQALGSDVERTKRIVFFATSLLTAACVSVSGMVGFVGLVAPHAMRRVVGPVHRRLLPATFLASGTLLVLADAVARTVVRPSELPVGAVTALIGVPTFAVLLRRSLR